MANTQPSRPRKILAYCEDQQPYKKEGCQKSLIGLNDTLHHWAKPAHCKDLSTDCSESHLKAIRKAKLHKHQGKIRLNTKKHLDLLARETPTGQDRLVIAIMDMTDQQIVMMKQILKMTKQNLTIFQNQTCVSLIGIGMTTIMMHTRIETNYAINNRHKTVQLGYDHKWPLSTRMPPWFIQSLPSRLPMTRLGLWIPITILQESPWPIEPWLPSRPIWFCSSHTNKLLKELPENKKTSGSLSHQSP